MRPLTLSMTNDDHDDNVKDWNEDEDEDDDEALQEVVVDCDCPCSTPGHLQDNRVLSGDGGDHWSVTVVTLAILHMILLN